MNQSHHKRSQIQRLLSSIVYILASLLLCQSSYAQSTSPSITASVTTWHCLCYQERYRGAVVNATACRQSLNACDQLQKRVERGSRVIVRGSLHKGCTEVSGRHPQDLLGGRGRWLPSKRAGATWTPHGCYLTRSSTSQLDRDASITTDHRTGVEWILIKGGSLMMGGHSQTVATPDHNQTRQRIELSDFWMAKSEVTVGQYQACVDAGICSPPKMGGHCHWGRPRRERYPVNCVTWWQAYRFSQWVGGELPREAEWEYAARSRGIYPLYPWGEQHPNSNHPQRRARLEPTPRHGDVLGTPVCSRPWSHSREGICDLVGSLREWTFDQLKQTKASRANPRSEHIIRGAHRVGDTSDSPENNALVSMSHTAQHADELVGFRPIKRSQSGGLTHRALPPQVINVKPSSITPQLPTHPQARPQAPIPHQFVKRPLDPTKAHQQITGVLNAQTPRFERRPTHAYTIKLAPYEILSVSMRASFDSYLKVIGPRMNLTADVDGLTHHAALTTSVIGGTYTIYAMGFTSDAQGGYTLDISRLQTRGEISSDRGALQADSPRLSTRQPYALHHFQAQRGDRVELVMHSDEFDSYLKVIGPGLKTENDDGHFNRYHRHSAQTDAHLLTPPLQNGQYTIFATASHEHAQGSYQLKLRRLRPVADPSPHSPLLPPATYAHQSYTNEARGDLASFDLLSTPSEISEVIFHMNFEPLVSLFNQDVHPRVIIREPKQTPLQFQIEEDGGSFTPNAPTPQVTLSSYHFASLSDRHPPQVWSGLINPQRRPTAHTVHLTRGLWIYLEITSPCSAPTLEVDGALMYPRYSYPNSPGRRFQKSALVMPILHTGDYTLHARASCANHPPSARRYQIKLERITPTSSRLRGHK